MSPPPANGAIGVERRWNSIPRTERGSIASRAASYGEGRGVGVPRGDGVPLGDGLAVGVGAAVAVVVRVGSTEGMVVLGRDASATNEPDPDGTEQATMTIATRAAPTAAPTDPRRSTAGV
jgi:hypothetical protein